MRTLSVLRSVTVCEAADGIRDPANQTASQIYGASARICPLAGPCSAGSLLGPSLRNCVPAMAQSVARQVATSGASVEQEIADFSRSPIYSRLGFIDPYGDPDPDATVTDRGEIVRRVTDWTQVILGGPSMTLVEQIEAAHCDCHSTFSEGCVRCGVARTIVRDRTETVFPDGVATVVPRDRCRCPVMRVGDFCPVHGG